MIQTEPALRHFDYAGVEAIFMASRVPRGITSIRQWSITLDYDDSDRMSVSDDALCLQRSRLGSIVAGERMMPDVIC
jgi:hypothetical protein